jgi:hypothetical protein
VRVLEALASTVGLEGGAGHRGRHRRGGWRTTAIVAKVSAAIWRSERETARGGEAVAGAEAVVRRFSAEGLLCRRRAVTLRERPGKGSRGSSRGRYSVDIDASESIFSLLSIGSALTPLSEPTESGSG